MIDILLKIGAQVAKIVIYEVGNTLIDSAVTKIKNRPPTSATSSAASTELRKIFDEAEKAEKARRAQEALKELIGAKK